MHPSKLLDMAITTICDVTRRPGGLVGRRMPERGNHISVLVAKNLMLSAFIFKLMEHCSKPYDIKHVNRRQVLEYQHQLKLEQNAVLHLKLLRVVQGVPLAYVVRHHIKVAYISPEYSAYVNLDKEMITRGLIVDAKLNLRITQECLDGVYLS